MKKTLLSTFLIFSLALVGCTQQISTTTRQLGEPVPITNQNSNNSTPTTSKAVESLCNNTLQRTEILETIEPKLNASIEKANSMEEFTKWLESQECLSVVSAPTDNCPLESYPPQTRSQLEFKLSDGTTVNVNMLIYCMEKVKEYQLEDQKYKLNNLTIIE